MLAKTAPCLLSYLNRLYILCSFFLFTCQQMTAQITPAAQKTIQAVIQRQQQLQRVTYTIHRLDTFTTATILEHTGHCDITMDSTDPLFGFSFRANRDDIPSETVYTGANLFKWILKSVSIL